MNLFPGTPPFFSMFLDLAKLNTEAGTLLVKAKPGSTNLNFISKQVRSLEASSDTLFHTLREEADKTFITPIDREDIYSLGKHLNSIVDYIENVTTSLYLFKISGAKEISKYTVLVKESTEKMEQLIELLSHKGKYVVQMKRAIHEIFSLEKQGDETMRDAYATLFAGKHTPTHIIAWKHIYDNLELILNECEHTADTVNDIILKNY